MIIIKSLPLHWNDLAFYCRRKRAHSSSLLALAWIGLHGLKFFIQKFRQKNLKKWNFFVTNNMTGASRTQRWEKEREKKLCRQFLNRETAGRQCVTLSVTRVGEILALWQQPHVVYSELGICDTFIVVNGKILKKQSIYLVTLGLTLLKTKFC